MNQKLRWVLLILATVPLAATIAHVVELPNKFLMDGPLWLGVQQRLYYGWGLAVGPFEVGAILLAWILVIRHRHFRRRFFLALATAVLFSLCLVVFFTMNLPVNTAFAVWTPATLPTDWPAYRLQWELGHALSFVFWLAGFLALIRAMVIDRLERPAPVVTYRRLGYESEILATEKR
jgi:hypothetical protein